LKNCLHGCVASWHVANSIFQHICFANNSFAYYYHSAIQHLCYLLSLSLYSWLVWYGHDWWWTHSMLNSFDAGLVWYWTQVLLEHFVFVSTLHDIHRTYKLLWCQMTPSTILTSMKYDKLKKYISDKAQINKLFFKENFWQKSLFDN